MKDKGQTHTKLSTLIETDWSILMVCELFSCVKIKKYRECGSVLSYKGDECLTSDTGYLLKHSQGEPFDYLDSTGP